MKTVELSFKVACLFEGTLLICPLYEESSSFLETKLDWEIGSKKMESRLEIHKRPVAPSVPVPDIAVLPLRHMNLITALSAM